MAMLTHFGCDLILCIDLYRFVCTFTSFLTTFTHIKVNKAMGKSLDSSESSGTIKCVYCSEIPRVARASVIILCGCTWLTLQSSEGFDDIPHQCPLACTLRSDISLHSTCGCTNRWCSEPYLLMWFVLCLF